MRTSKNILRAVLFGVVAAALACGGGSTSSTPTTPTLGTTVQTNTITITSAGVSPNNIQIAQGSRVLFVNNDSKTHNMVSDPHPEHTDCPPINSVGFLAPGKSIETGNMTVVRSCGFHDHDDTSSLWKGQITIK